MCDYNNSKWSNIVLYMNKTDDKGIIKLLLVVAAVCTTAYLLMLGRFNTLSLDDYGFVDDLSTVSPWEWMQHMYMTWQGRFSWFITSGYIFEFWGRKSRRKEV